MIRVSLSSCLKKCNCECAKNRVTSFLIQEISTETISALVISDIFRSMLLAFLVRFPEIKRLPKLTEKEYQAFQLMCKHTLSLPPRDKINPALGMEVSIGDHDLLSSPMKIDRSNWFDLQDETNDFDLELTPPTIGGLFQRGFVMSATSMSPTQKQLCETYLHGYLTFGFERNSIVDPINPAKVRHFNLLIVPSQLYDTVKEQLQYVK